MMLLSDSSNQPVKEQEAAELAIVYVKERQYDEALSYFQKVKAFSPRALSYFGLALAMRRQRLNDAVEFCRQAVDRDPIRAEFYFNLGQVYLIRQDKKLAVRAFWQGLKAEPGHSDSLGMLKRLGMRQRPALAGISRTNPLNRYLGWFRHRLGISQ